MGKRTTRRVTVETMTVGQGFGCCGVLRDAKSRRRLVLTDVVPFQFEEVARARARYLAAARGWIAVTEDGGYA